MSYEIPEEKPMEARKPDMAYGRRYTAADYLQWTMDYRVELIDGRIFKMSPAPQDPHQKISGELTALFHTFFKGKECEVRDAPYDVYLPRPNQHWKQAENVVQPDFCVICDRQKIKRRGCVGAPDFLVEILSPSTAVKDLTFKKQLYETHGVKEYWVISIPDRTLFIYLLNGGIFNEKTIVNPTMVSPQNFPDLKVDFQAIFDDLMEYDDD